MILTGINEDSTTYDKNDFAFEAGRKRACSAKASMHPAQRTKERWKQLEKIDLFLV